MRALLVRLYECCIWTTTSLSTNLSKPELESLMMDMSCCPSIPYRYEYCTSIPIILVTYQRTVRHKLRRTVRAASAALLSSRRQ